MTEQEILEGIKNQNPQVLAKTMSLFESQKDSDKKLAAKILHQIEKDDYPTRVLGITGTPGVGKSTFLNGFVDSLVQRGNKVAILTIDPSSEKTGGSILGDKTRMTDLIKHENVFIRPSASRAMLGGVSANTRDLITLCEAASFDYIFVESVGIGQSEVQLAKIVDFLLLFLAPGGGDDLQGIKKGVLEFTDLLIVNKKDLGKTLALQTASLYGQSLENEPCVISALEKEGFEKVQQQIDSFYEKEDLAKIRFEKRKDFFWTRVESDVIQLIHKLKASDKLNKVLEKYLAKKYDLRKAIRKILKFI